MIERTHLRERIRSALSRSRVVLLTGARQVGKTTLARSFVEPDSLNYFDLEDPTDLARLDAPMPALERLEGLVVIDEIQRRPDLFPVLRVLSDRQPLPARFLILGSAAPHAIRQSSESLTGRVEVIEVSGFSLDEIGADQHDRLWLRGAYPEPFLASSDRDAANWLRQYVRNLAARDLREFGLELSSATIERYLGIAAVYHGQLWNSAALARSIDIAESTSRRYTDGLSDAHLVRILRPWTTNFGKRVVKTPKVYFRDSGLLHALLGVEDRASLERHPLVGASWEGMVIEEALKDLEGRARPYFWRTSNGAEMDLLLEFPSRLVGVEVKRTDSPTATKSIRNAVEDCKLDRVLIVYPGSKRFSINDKVDAVPISLLAAELRSLA
ncbi:MAG: ATP-binding protein [Actinobacteria bacterium]|nr:ATP-binding protein [Actinomycetota bacterium]